MNGKFPLESRPLCNVHVMQLSSQIVWCGGSQLQGLKLIPVSSCMVKDWIVSAPPG